MVAVRSLLAQALRQTGRTDHPHQPLGCVGDRRRRHEPRGASQASGPLRQRGQGLGQHGARVAVIPPERRGLRAQGLEREGRGQPQAPRRPPGAGLLPLWRGRREGYGGARSTYRVYSDRLELYYLAFPRGGEVAISVDDAEPVLVSTMAETATDAWRVFEAPERGGEHTFTVKATGRVHLYGVTLERDGPGVVYDCVGMIGTRASAPVVGSSLGAVQRYDVLGRWWRGLRSGGPHRDGVAGRWVGDHGLRARRRKHRIPVADEREHHRLGGRLERATEPHVPCPPRAGADAEVLVRGQHDHSHRPARARRRGGPPGTASAPARCARSW